MDSDDASTPNGQIRYSIVGPANALSYFTIEPVSGNITSRLSLVSVPEDIYTVSYTYANIIKSTQCFSFVFSEGIKVLSKANNSTDVFI